MDGFVFVVLDAGAATICTCFCPGEIELLNVQGYLVCMAAFMIMFIDTFVVVAGAKPLLPLLPPPMQINPFFSLSETGFSSHPW